VVREALVTDLEIVDYLELFNSTVQSSQMLCISQSSCSRRYRSFSQRFGIGFDRIGDRYQATANFDVLAGLRQASQKLRVRQGVPRFCLGWQVGDVALPGLDTIVSVLPMRPMNTWRLLSLLEQRLVDVALMGLLEFERLLANPLQSLRARRMALSPMVMCMPFLSFQLRLLAHASHPLHREAVLDPEMLALYPSPALPLGMAPSLMGALQGHGLASQPCGLSNYEESGWEGFARDGVGLSYGAPYRLKDLGCRYELRPVAFDLGIREYLGFVGHRDVLGDPGFHAILAPMMEIVRPALAHHGVGVHWLS